VNQLDLDEYYQTHLKSNMNS